jgi:hypothetical protein
MYAVETDVSEDMRPPFSGPRNDKQKTSKLATCFHAGFLLGLFFDTENGSMFFRNVDFQWTASRQSP